MFMFTTSDGSSQTFAPQSFTPAKWARSTVRWMVVLATAVALVAPTASASTSSGVQARRAIHSSVEAASVTGDAKTWAPVVIALAAAIGVLFAIVTIDSSRRIAKAERTAAIIGRYDEAPHVELAPRAQGFLKTHSREQEKARWASFQSAVHAGARVLPTRWPPNPRVPSASKTDIRVHLGVFENIGALFNAGYLDEALVCRLAGSLTVRTYCEAKWYIARRGGTPLNLETEARTSPRSSDGWWPLRRRQRFESGLYEEFARMCVELVRLNPKTLGKLERDIAQEARSKDVRWTGARMEWGIRITSDPTTPGSLRVTFPSKGHARFSWSAPLSSGGSRITGYQMRVYDITHRKWTAWHATSHLFLVQAGLTRHHKYTAEVRAMTASAGGAPATKSFTQGK